MFLLGYIFVKSKSFFLLTEFKPKHSPVIYFLLSNTRFKLLEILFCNPCFKGYQANLHILSFKGVYEVSKERPQNAFSPDFAINSKLT